MIDWRDVPVHRRSVVTIPVIWVAILLSLHFHAVMMWIWLPQMPHAPHLSFDEAEKGEARPALVTRLAETPRPEASAPPAPPPSPSLATAVPRRPQPPSPPAIRRPPPPSPPPAPAIVAPSPRPVEVPKPQPQPQPQPPVAAPAPPATDLASYIEARRQARGEVSPGAQGNAPQAPPQETDIQRRDRIVASNLASVQSQTFGYDPKSSGGVFQLRHLGYDEAEFWFTGWDKEIGRRAKQNIEVRTGNNGDIRLAVVRKMIAIIRDEVQGDFQWRSDRLGHDVKMSARPADNQVLEDFLMLEFFANPRLQPVR